MQVSSKNNKWAYVLKIVKAFIFALETTQKNDLFQNISKTEAPKFLQNLPYIEATYGYRMG